MIDRSGYRAALRDLEAAAATVPNTRLGAIGKVTALTVMNMRWERVAFDRDFPEDPLPVAERFVRDAATQVAAWGESLFIEGASDLLQAGPVAMEDRHQALFQALWTEFSQDEYLDRIARYEHRLAVNGLADGFLEGASVIDMGCGHGNFAHALRRAGAARVLGVDFGANSIAYARAAAERVGTGGIDFKLASVYDTGEAAESFDFAVQNGVFHHLDNEDAAYREILRVLKPGGWAWIYTDGADTVAGELWDASVRVLAGVPDAFVLETLDHLGIETGKRYHLGDSLNAIYRHTSWAELTSRLTELGFGEVKRLVGGFPTDFDHDVIAADPWGPQKFGEGDLRLLARKL